MRIDLSSIDRSKFLVEESIILSNGAMIYFVKPDLNAIKQSGEGIVWTQQNKIFRSSVWNENGELISASFPKFMNWGENPQHFPVPSNLNDVVITEKIDGSCLILSKYRGHYIIRTRGTLDASSLKNGYEIEIFKERIVGIIERFVVDETWNISWIFEWTSPTQRIVINYGDEPKWTLIGCVQHDNYKLYSQSQLDKTADILGFNRPPTYKFSNIEELLSTIDAWKGKEGAVAYSNGGQTLHKVKSAWYLALHRMKTELASRDKVIKTWFALGRPSYRDFYKKVCEDFDYELANQIKGDMSLICDAWKKVQEILDGFQKFINNQLLPLGDPQDRIIRKKMVDVVFSSYGKTNRAGFVFTLLDGRELDDAALEKLIYQCLKSGK